MIGQFFIAYVLKVVDRSKAHGKVLKGSKDRDFLGRYNEKFEIYVWFAALLQLKLRKKKLLSRKQTESVCF